MAVPFFRSSSVIHTHKTVSDPNLPVNREDIRRKTKIVCTLGPKTSTVEQIAKLLEAGMNIARLNFSHGTHESHKKLIDNIREAASQTGKLCAILLDTKGPEIRTGKLKNPSGVKINEGQTFTFFVADIEGDENGVSLSYKNFPKQLRNGAKILCADGKLGFMVEKVEEDRVVTRAENSGVLGEKKNCNLPQTHVDLPTLGETDIDDILFGVANGIDFIAASFIRTPEDVRTIRALPGVGRAPGGEPGPMIISKIENQQGLDNFEEILAESDGIMVARGDLGMEVPLEKVGVYQKKMIQMCNIAGKPVITATQMLESMITNPRPTRAEATDVLNAVLDGTDAVMLSGETANGDFPMEAVKCQSKISATAESIIEYHTLHSRFRELLKPPVPFQESIAFAAVQCSEDIKASLILVVTASGTMARRISKNRPRCPILAVTWSERVARELLISNACLPFLVSEMPNHEGLVKVVKRALQLRVVLPGDSVVLAFGQTGVPMIHNTVSVITVGNFD